jgi:hypothetical protein
MVDVLDLYEEAYDPRYPVVCEKLVTLHADVRIPLPAEPGPPERIDDEYERLGTANLFFSPILSSFLFSPSLMGTSAWQVFSDTL